MNYKSKHFFNLIFNSAWLRFTKGVAFNYNWDRKPLAIKTTSEAQRWVYILSEAGDLVEADNGIRADPEYISVAWTIKQDNSYGVWVGFHHLDENEESFKDVPSSPDKVWTLFKLKRKLVIECNGLRVYELHYKDMFDRKDNLQRSIKGWSKTVKKVQFGDLDESTQFYRPVG